MKIVDQVFAQRHPGELRRWLIASLLVTAVYALVFVALPLVASPSLEDWAAALAARVHAELDRDREIAIETPPPPPPRAVPLPSPPPSRPTSVRARPAVRPPAPAQTASVIARVPEATPVDFTTTAFVTGTATTYAGGTSTSSGTTRHAVEGREVAAGGSTQAGSRTRPVSLDEASWSCPWPREAESTGINEQTVVLRVNVESDGAVQTVKIVTDPGSGFGEAARTCALQTRFHPARDPSGEATAAWSPPIRVRFVR
jgi:protein TonB